MKITCQACAAKYTIADDKVRGKTVKIKCKKCGASIVASGKDGESVAPAASAPAELYWTVNVGEGDQRSVSAGEIEQLLSAGYVNATSFAWRDGMSDWLPLSQVPELAGLFPESAEMSGTPEMSGLGQDHGDHGDHGNREIDEDMPTKMERGASLLDMAAGVPVAAGTPAGPFAASPSPFAPSPAPVAPAARAARAAPAGGDLFAPRAIEPVAPAPAPMRPGNIIDDEASGLIDIRNLSASLGNKGAAPAKPALPQKNALDDVMALGGQPLFSPAPLMAPPDLNAPPPAPPPPAAAFGAAPGAVAATPGFSAIPAPPQKKSSAGLIVGVLGLVIAAAAVGALVMSKKGGDEPKTPIAADSKTADAASAAKPAESVAAAPTSTIPSSAPEGTTPDKGDHGTVKADDKKKDPKADDKKKDTKAEDKKKEEEAKRKEEEAKKKEAEKKKEPDPPPVAAGGGSDAAFDRGAAMSAMGAAANNVSQCKKSDGPTGSGRVAVTFAPSGNVTNAVVNGDPFAGTSVGGCVAAKFRAVKVPPFGGSPVTVNKTFTIN